MSIDEPGQVFGVCHAGEASSAAVTSGQTLLGRGLGVEVSRCNGWDAGCQGAQ